ncbi:MAG: hypothetical protein LBP76_12880 [Treponema sp.]|jgi:hypothetical protein|nr:hypothetical protein [Treponema sp.]
MPAKMKRGYIGMEVSAEEQKKIDEEDDKIISAMGKEFPVVESFLESIKSSPEYAKVVEDNKASVKNKFIDKNITMTFHKSKKSDKNIWKDYLPYARRKYLPFIMGCKILYFERRPEELPMVYTRNDVNYVVGPGEGDVSLREYFGGNKNVSVEDLCNSGTFLKNFRLKKNDDIPAENILISYYLEKESAGFGNKSPIDIGNEFLQELFELNLPDRVNNAGDRDLGYNNEKDKILESKPKGSASFHTLDALIRQIEGKKIFYKKRKYVPSDPAKNATIRARKYQIINEFINVLNEAPPGISPNLNQTINKCIEELKSAPSRDRVKTIVKWMRNESIAVILKAAERYKIYCRNLSRWAGGVEYDSLPGDSSSPRDSITYFSSNNEELFLFFKAAFEGDDDYLDAVHEYLLENENKFRDDLYQYINRGGVNTSYLKILYFQHSKKRIYIDEDGTRVKYTKFNKKIREILDAVFTEHLVYCGREELIRIYSKYFCHSDESIFLCEVESDIKKYFRQFKDELTRLSVAHKQGKPIESAIRKVYHKLLKENFRVPDDVPPFLDEVVLRKKINEISKTCFKKLRVEYLMAFSYRSEEVHGTCHKNEVVSFIPQSGGKWVCTVYRESKWKSGYFKEYFKTKPTNALEQQRKKIFNDIMKNIAKEIAQSSIALTRGFNGTDDV